MLHSLVCDCLENVRLAIITPIRCSYIIVSTSVTTILNLQTKHEATRSGAKLTANVSAVSLMMWINHNLSSLRSSICRCGQVTTLCCYSKCQHCSIKVASFHSHRHSAFFLVRRKYKFIYRDILGVACSSHMTTCTWLLPIMKMHDPWGETIILALNIHRFCWFFFPICLI